MGLSDAERARRARDRRAGRLAPVLTCGCGRRAIGEHAPLCRQCWLKTPEGLAAEADRIRRLRAARRS